MVGGKRAHKGLLGVGLCAQSVVEMHRVQYFDNSAIASGVIKQHNFSLVALTTNNNTTNTTDEGSRRISTSVQFSEFTQLLDLDKVRIEDQRYQESWS